MRIVCVLKSVPDPRASVQALPDGSGVDLSRVKHVCDPFAEFGIELALQTRERCGPSARVTAAAVGGATSVETLRHALAMGCDRAIHAVDEATAFWDEIRLAALVAGLIQAGEPAPDLIICGKQSIDSDMGAIGPALAELLGLPLIGAVTTFEMASDARSFRASHRLEGVEEVIEATLPALVTVEKGLVEPRRPALARMIKAKQQPIDSFPAATHEGRTMARLQRVGPPPSRGECSLIEGEPVAIARELVRRLRDEAKVI